MAVVWTNTTCKARYTIPSTAQVSFFPNPVETQHMYTAVEALRGHEVASCRYIAVGGSVVLTLHGEKTTTAATDKRTREDLDHYN